MRAPYEISRRQGDQGRFGGGAFGCCPRAARVEHATARRRGRIRRFPGQSGRTAQSGIGPGHGRKKGLGIRVDRVGVKRPGRGQFHVLTSPRLELKLRAGGEALSGLSVWTYDPEVQFGPNLASGEAFLPWWETTFDAARGQRPVLP